MPTLELCELETGDIITAKVHSFKLLRHVGYVVKEENEIFVIHNTPDKKNPFGGNIIKETLQEFCESRSPLTVERTGKTKEEIESYAAQKKHIVFDTIKHNCEHFVNGIKEGYERSPQLYQWTAIVCLLIVILATNEDE